MTNTDTADALATAAQVADLARAGSEIVRITVNDMAAAMAVAATARAATRCFPRIVDQPCPAIRRTSWTDCVWPEVSPFTQ